MKPIREVVTVPPFPHTILSVIALAILVWLVYFVIEVSRTVGVWPF